MLKNIEIVINWFNQHDPNAFEKVFDVDNQKDTMQSGDLLHLESKLIEKQKTSYHRRATVKQSNLNLPTKKLEMVTPVTGSGSKNTKDTS